MTIKRKVKDPVNQTYQDIIGMSAKVIGTNNLRPTEDIFGTGSDMYDFIDKIGTIRSVVLESDYVTNKDGEEVEGIDYIEGISMFGYSWAIADIEIIPPKETIKLKVLKFNPKTLFEGPKEDGHKHKRVSNGSSNKRRSENKRPKRNTNKTVTKRSSK